MTIAELFEALGGTSEVARGIGVRQSTASEMKRRQSIPVKYWADFIRIAGAKKIDLDVNKLHAMHCAQAHREIA